MHSEKARNTILTAVVSICLSGCATLPDNLHDSNDQDLRTDSVAQTCTPELAGDNPLVGGKCSSSPHDIEVTEQSGPPIPAEKPLPAEDCGRWCRFWAEWHQPVWVGIGTVVLVEGLILAASHSNEHHLDHETYECTSGTTPGITVGPAPQTPGPGGYCQPSFSFSK